MNFNKERIPESFCYKEKEAFAGSWVLLKSELKYFPELLVYNDYGNIKCSLRYIFPEGSKFKEYTITGFSINLNVKDLIESAVFVIKILSNYED